MWTGLFLPDLRQKVVTQALDRTGYLGKTKTAVKKCEKHANANNCRNIWKQQQTCETKRTNFFFFAFVLFRFISRFLRFWLYFFAILVLCFFTFIPGKSAHTADRENTLKWNFIVVRL